MCVHSLKKLRWWIELRATAPAILELTSRMKASSCPSSMMITSLLCDQTISSPRHERLDALASDWIAERCGDVISGVVDGDLHHATYNVELAKPLVPVLLTLVGGDQLKVCLSDTKVPSCDIYVARQPSRDVDPRLSLWS